MAKSYPAPLSQNAFLGIDPATLATMQAEYLTAIREVSSTGQSYTVQGRQMSAADLGEMEETLRHITQAIRAANRQVRVSMRPRFY